MKFKFNFLERRLWRIEEDYLYEISEDNHFHTPQGIYGSEGWSLGNQEEIIFTFSHSNLKVYYRIGIVAWQKTLDLPPNCEIIFEFTETDRINSS
jgi:hypothetical protein